MINLLFLIRGILFEIWLTYFWFLWMVALIRLINLIVIYILFILSLILVMNIKWVLAFGFILIQIRFFLSRCTQSYATSWYLKRTSRWLIIFKFILIFKTFLLFNDLVMIRIFRIQFHDGILILTQIWKFRLNFNRIIRAQRFLQARLESIIVESLICLHYSYTILVVMLN